MTEVQARYFDGETARQVDVIARFSSQDVVVCDLRGGVLAVWPADDVRLVSKPVKGQTLRLGLAKDTARLAVADASCLAELERLYPDIHKLRPRVREVWRPIAFWSAVATVSAAFLFMIVVPFVAREVAKAIPPSVETQLGEATADQVAQYFSRSHEADYCSTPEGDAALRTLTARFGAQADLPYPLTVRIVDSGMVNAFTLPGGQIILFRGLLEFVDGPEEVAGVLAHEIGHVERRHPMEGFVKNASAATLIGFLLGDITGGSVVGVLAQLTVTAAYTRDLEREADAHAVDLLNGAGISGAGMVDFFERLREKETSDLQSFMAIARTHPASADRSDFMRDNTTGTGDAMTAAEWQALQEICDDQV